MILRSIVVVLVAVLASASAKASVTEVRLLSGVRVDEGAPVTIADVAEVSGPQAGLIGPVELLSTPGDSGDPLARATVTIEDLAGAIASLDGVHHGRLRLGGSSCLIGIRPAPRPVELIETQAPRVVPEGPTVRSRITDHVRAMFKDHANDARVTFREADGAVLDEPTEGVTLEIRTLGVSEQMPLAVTIYDGDRIVLNTTVRAKVQLEQRVAVLIQDVARGRAIGAEMVRFESRWVAPNELGPAPETVIGRLARSRLKAGTAIGPDDVATPDVVERGDRVAVRSVVGSAVVRSTARALENGAPGDLIMLETIDRKTKFQARVAGPGRAVVAASTPQPGRDDA